VALTATRNEDWILGLSLRASLSFCDAVIISDHSSSDATGEILEALRTEYPDRLIDVHRTASSEWREAEVRQEMLERGRRLGGTHFVIVDADEVPTGNLLPRLRELVLRLRPGRCASLPMISPYHSASVYRFDGAWGEGSGIPWAFADHSDLTWRLDDDYQLHRRAPRGASDVGLAVPGRREGGLFHLQFVNRQRLASKAAWYKMMETVTYPGRRTAADLNLMYDWTLREDAQIRLESVPPEWWAPYRERGWLKHFRPDAPAWQSSEARRLLERYGQARFSGLELYGVV
jgi:hypothetical protein